MNVDVQLVPTSTASPDEGSLELFTCDICSQTFTSHLNLTVHKQTHESENQYKCSYCSKMFSRRSYWRVHELGHSRPFRCELCNQSFTRQYNLTVHLRVHTGEKPYRCDECGQSFTRQYTLVLHKRMHSGEKPHECPVCNRRFSRMQTMRSHVKTHSSEHICSKCNLAFPNREKLDRHIMTHHKGDKPYICNICGFRCSFSSSLQRHKQKHKLEEQTSPPAMPVIDKLMPNPEMMHPAQVTRLEQNIGFLRDQQEHAPSVNRPHNDNPEGDFSRISPIAAGGASSVTPHEPSWMVLNDGRIINVGNASPAFPQIAPEAPGMRNQYFPSQDTPPTSLGLPSSRATSSSHSPSVSSDNGRSDAFHPTRKNEDKLTSCIQGNDIVISNVCSLTPSKNLQSGGSGIEGNKTDSQVSEESDDNNASSENTQESTDAAPLNSSSLNCIEQMLQRQDSTEHTKMTDDAEKADRDCMPARDRTKATTSITGSQKRKASLLHGYFRDVSKEQKELEERSRKRHRPMNTGSELQKRLSHFTGGGLGNCTNSEVLTIGSSDRVQTTDVSTSTSNTQQRDCEDARGFQHDKSNTEGAVRSEPQSNRPRSQIAVSTSSGQAAGSRTWRCEHCGVTFEDNVMFIIHMGCHSNQNPFQCNSCGKLCQNRVDFMLHFISGNHQG
ncbi:uncharacterized protein [Ptychodera flava]|uniref:uncharacterized protein n=1 Tax=Ptychodera flava TaxID=63121 RepID=UPI00396A6E84